MYILIIFCRKIANLDLAQNNVD